MSRNDETATLALLKFLGCMAIALLGLYMVNTYPGFIGSLGWPVLAIAAKLSWGPVQTLYYIRLR